MISAAAKRTWHLVLLATFAGLLGSGQASAATHTFSWLVDTDNSVATGCTLGTAHGPLAGVEEVFAATVTTTTAGAGVTRLERRTCAGGMLGAATAYDTSAWPVGLGLGTGGSAVIETYAPLSMLPQRGTVKVVVTSTNATGGEDATAPFLIVLDASQPLAAVIPVPLSRWLVLPIALLLFAAAQRWYRRHPGQRQLGLFFALCVLAGIACAATVVLDGNPADWVGTSPAVTDPVGNAPPNADIVAVYQRREATRLFVRIDADIRVEDVAEQGPKLAAIPDQVISLGNRLRLRIAANDPDTFDTLTFGLVTAPSGATFNPVPVLAWTPTAAQLGPHAFTVSATDSAGHGDTRSFTVTVINADRPPVLADQPDATLALGSTFSRILVAADPDTGDVLTFALVSAPAGMTLSGATLTWPTSTATLGSHPVTVSVIDSAGAMDARQFHVILSPSAPPVANADSYIVHLGDTLTIAAAGVLANDIDPFGRPLTASKLSDPDKGTLAAFQSDGGFTYQAPAAPPGSVFTPVLRNHTDLSDSAPGGNSVLIDLDGDGKPELVRYGFNHNIYAIHADTGQLLWRFSGSFFVGCTPYGGVALLAAADIDDDGNPDVIFAGSCAGDNGSMRLVALNGQDGTVKWTSPALAAIPVVGDGAGLTSYAVPTIARLRSGESPSVLINVQAQGARRISVTDSGTIVEPACRLIVDTVPDGDYQPNPGLPPHYQQCRGVIVLNGSDGTVRQRMIARQTPISGLDGGTEQTGLSAPVVVDLDGDGVPEIVAGGVVFNLNGTPRWQGASANIREVAVGNFDDTPDVEVVRFEEEPGRYDYLSVYKSDGSVLWRLPFDYTTFIGKIVVGDLDGGGKADIVMNVGALLCAIKHDGTYRWCNYEVVGGVSLVDSRTRVAIFDFDGDGVAEVVLQTTQAILFLDGLSGKLKASFPISKASTGSIDPPPDGEGITYHPNAPLVGDVDGDGRADLMFFWTRNATARGDYGAPAALTVLKGQSNDWRPARGVQNQFAYHVANINDNGTIPTAVPLPNNFAVPRTNVFGTQAQTLAPVDPRKSTQTSFTYKANDGAFDSSSATVTIDIVPVNRPPVFDSTPPTRYNQFFAPFSYAAHATDPDAGDTITYRIVFSANSDGCNTINATTGVLSCARLNDPNAFFLIAATDSQGAETVQTIRMTGVTTSSTVPNVVGQAQLMAATTLATAGLAVGIVTPVFSGAPVGQVLAQSPSAGTAALTGEGVALSVSNGPQPAPTPNVTGSTLGSAATVLAASGFSVGATSYMYSSVERGEILSQSPAPGVSQVPGPVDVSVSGGTGLEIQLAQSVTTADTPITFSVVAREPNGALQSTPPIVLAITPAIPAFAVNTPTVVGGQIVPNANSLGAYTLTATDPVTHRSASAGFAVSHAPPPGTASNIGEFARFSQVLINLGILRERLQAAHDANDIPAMRARLQDMVDLWHTLDLTTLIGSAPVAPKGGFPPRIDDMAAFGVTQAPEDVLYKTVLTDAAADLKALQDAWTDPTTSLATLNTLNATFQTRAKRLQGLVPGEYGLVDGIPALTAILSVRGPRELDAMFKDVETLLANPAKSMFASKRVALKSSLGEQLTVLAVEAILAKLEKPYIQFMLDSVRYAAWTSAIMVIRGHLKTALDAGDIYGIVSGASLSIHIFEQPYSMIEGNDLETKYPDLNEVWILGPDIPSSVLDLISGIKDTFNYFHSVDPNAKLKDLDAAKTKVDEFKKKLQEGVVNPTQAVVDAIQAAYQVPTDASQPCVFSADPACKELFYPDGFKRVYTYSGQLQLPVPILFLVFNAVNGKVLLDTPAFMPCKKDEPCGAP